MRSMYFVSRININKNGSFGSMEIVDHAKYISEAKNLLILITKQHLEKEYGSLIISTTKILDIQSFTQVVEPIIDSVLIYRLETDPHSLHIYQRKSIIVPGRVYGQSVTSEFRKSMIFGVNEYTKTISESNTSDKNETLIPNRTDIKKISVETHSKSPLMANLLSSLKQSPKFLLKKELSDKTSTTITEINKKILGEKCL